LKELFLSEPARSVRLQQMPSTAGGPAGWSQADDALVELGTELAHRGYRFTTVTPATHRRVSARHAAGLSPAPASLTDVFGWSRSFALRELPRSIASRLLAAGACIPCNGRLRSSVRFSTLERQIFIHSAYPTDDAEAVFFGPDTYRFAREVRRVIRTLPRERLRILDMGAGSGAGGLYAAQLAGRACGEVVLADINPRAVRYCRINAALNGRTAMIVESNLYDRIDGQFDLIISNPPYLVDPQARFYRHGGGPLGSALSLAIVEQGIDLLRQGGRLLLYTGSAIVAGHDALRAALLARVAARGVSLDYEEIDVDVFGEELERAPYERADRIAVVCATVTRERGEQE
jgi:SAM-dependent methyltransferase